MLQVPVITIDGPSGSGKGTISRMVAHKLGWNMLDSGALYRVLAFYAELKGAMVTDVAMLANLASELPVDFTLTEINTRTTLEGRDVTEKLYNEHCGSIASQIAVYPEVRQALLAKQRDFRKAPGLVADGRDMGTIIFPEANFKFFLDASIAVRAQRRYEQLLAAGVEADLQEMMGVIAKRDERDRNRVIAPLKPALDAVVIDTSNMSKEEVFTKVIAQVTQ